MKKISILILIFISLLSCKKAKLDNLAFPSQKLDSYLLYNAKEGEVSVPEEYDIPENQHHLFTVNSKDKISGETYKIYCLYIGDTTLISTDTVILYCHGQSKHMDNYYSRAQLLANLGGKNNYGILMMDYRGYGMSEGSSTENGLIEDVEACIDWLISKGAQEDKTFYYAYSLGCVPGIYHAAFHPSFKPTKLIIESPLASVQYLTQSSTLINVESSFITSLKFENAENIKNVTAPLLWMHGIEDTYIAIENGEIIYKNHGGIIKKAIRVEGSDHSEIPTKMGFENYLQILHNFIIE